MKRNTVIFLSYTLVFAILTMLWAFRGHNSKKLVNRQEEEAILEMGETLTEVLGEKEKIFFMLPESTSLHQTTQNRQFDGRWGILTRLRSATPINPRNIPDPWELSAIKRFEDDPSLPYVKGIENMDGKRYFRVAKPQLAARACLKCHDQEEGSLRGIISVAVPYDGVKRQIVNRYQRIRKTIDWGLIVGFLVLAVSYFLLLIMNLEVSNSAEREIKQGRKLKKQADDQIYQLHRIASGLLHELNTPLTFLKLTTDYIRNQLKQKEPDHERIDQRLKQSHEQIHRIEQLFIHLQEMGSSSDLKGEVRLQDVIKLSLVAMRSELNQAGILINQQIPAEAIFPAANACKLEQVFINLIQNSMAAINASGQGGQISITAENSPTALLIDFSDDGPGIPEEVAPHIFEPYFTTKEQGSGMGLPLIKDIIHSHDGEIELLASPIGTTFRIRFNLVMSRKEG